MDTGEQVLAYVTLTLMPYFGAESRMSRDAIRKFLETGECEHPGNRGHPGLP
jgi:hypothetical protein